MPVTEAHSLAPTEAEQRKPIRIPAEFCTAGEQGIDASRSARRPGTGDGGRDAG